MKEVIAEYQKKFEPVLNRLVRISFGNVPPFETVVRAVEKGVQKDMVNVPDKRVNAVGKAATPLSLRVVCEDGTLYFIIDDITGIVTTVRGLKINMRSYSVMMEFA